MVREVRIDEYQQLMELYLHLHETEIPPAALTKDLWERLVNDPDYHLIAAEEDGKLVSTCTCVIIPNLTHGPRPYAWVENVVTHPDYRGKGLATACLDFAKEIALRENCYRLVLMTGSKLESTLNFYERAGYNHTDKTGFIQWL
ncbi:MAG: GNAT family N-acetyltransferase [Oscillospiraceae bacterium]|nr:GNAT family N-acetyltransferase [Oscillospiraceae bacterium]